MFKHILLPIDGSELSLRAVKLGLELAQACKAKVYALHVVPPFHTFAYMAEMVTATEATYTRDASARAERYLAEVQQLAKAAGVDCGSSYLFNDHPHETIVQTSRTQHCDLVVMASHGWRGVTRLLLGSETHKTLLESEIPVLVCR